MTYEAKIETPQGLETVHCTDEQIDMLPPSSGARILRDEQRAGVYVSDAEIARQYHREAPMREAERAGEARGWKPAIRWPQAPVDAEVWFQIEFSPKGANDWALVDGQTWELLANARAVMRNLANMHVIHGDVEYRVVRKTVTTEVAE
jgi:hypothetical protein